MNGHRSKLSLLLLPYDLTAWLHFSRRGCVESKAVPLFYFRTFALCSAHAELEPAADARSARRLGFRLVGFSGGRVDDRSDLTDLVGRESAEFGMLPDEIFVRRDVDAVDLVISDIALKPLDFGSKLVQHGTGGLRYPLKIGGAEFACARNVTFDYKFRHSVFPHSTGQSGLI